MSVSELGLAYSLSEFISSNASIPAHIKYDGMSLPKDKPFALVETRPSSNEQLSKQRETINITYRFQIGIFANSSYELSGYREILNELFLFEEIPYYDEEGTKTDKYFSIESDFRIVPIFSDDISKETTRHRFYIDAEVKVNTHKNR